MWGKVDNYYFPVGPTTPKQTAGHHFQGPPHVVGDHSHKQSTVRMSPTGLVWARTKVGDPCDRQPITAYSSRRTVSTTKKKMHVAGAAYTMRSVAPDQKPRSPVLDQMSFAAFHRLRSTPFCVSTRVITVVVRTSKGCVMKAAIIPANNPHSRR
mmetsp:Transcript_68152/g.120551  ORF Transcript_68152/g.120551 Transcript_68152/m.120551 type:complete len:154 (+) Transcript_68152:1-462(+)